MTMASRVERVRAVRRRLAREGPGASLNVAVAASLVLYKLAGLS